MLRLGHCGIAAFAPNTTYHQGIVYTVDAVVDQRTGARYAQSMGFVAVMVVMCSAYV
jgi:hypothetical protein